jgi:hypothetical protein
MQSHPWDNSSRRGDLQTLRYDGSQLTPFHPSVWSNHKICDAMSLRAEETNSERTWRCLSSAAGRFCFYKQGLRITTVIIVSRIILREERGVKNKLIESILHHTQWQITDAIKMNVGLIIAKILFYNFSLQVSGNYVAYITCFYSYDNNSACRSQGFFVASM